MLPGRIGRVIGTIRSDPSIVVIPLIAGIAGVIGSFAVAGSTPGFVAAPIAGFLARTLPAVVITAAILFLGSLGQALNLATAVVVSVILFAIAAAIGRTAGDRLDQPTVGSALVVVLVIAIAMVLTGAPVPAIAAGAGTGIVAGVDRLIGRSRPDSAVDEAEPQPELSNTRRRLLASLATLAGVGVIGALYQQVEGKRQSTAVPDSPAATGATDGAAGADSTPGGTSDDVVQQLLAEAAEKSLAVDGMEPLVSEKFYQVDINAVDPDLSAEDWTLTVTGEVEEELTLTYEELTARPAEQQFNTLRCVGEDLNGHKMDTALWTGTPIADLIEAAGPKGDCECVMLRAEDGYFEEFPLDALRTGFLAYGMNGETLPRGHGHPVRALIPGHWGEINVKWVTEIEVLNREADGYWEKRGWHGTGPVNTVAKLHAVNTLADGRRQLGGHAYAGTRGIDRVEVSVDDGETWAEATLSDPLPGDDVWRQWVYEYDAPSAAHTAVVRAVDGEGVVQPADETNAFPSGPTGWVSRRISSS